jgi:hypothetical protein
VSFRSRSASVPALLLLGVSLLIAVPGEGARKAGSVEFVGTHHSGHSMRKVESRILRAGPKPAAAALGRTAMYLFVSESAEGWDADVAPGLAAALKTGPSALDRFASGLPDRVVTAGPDIDGAVVRFDLPDGRGRGVVALWFPDMLVRGGRPDPDLVSSRRPNKGLYASGVEVDADRTPSFTGLYLPSRPRGMARGRPPAVDVREFPRDGRGDLAIFAGRGGSGDDGERMRRDLAALWGSEQVEAKSLRTFPKDDDLVRDLKTFRSSQEVLELGDGGWYRTLAQDARDWEFKRRKVTHPTRYIAFSMPVVVGDEDTTRALVIGGVVLYTPLLIRPGQAPSWLGVDARSLYEAVQAGELPFLRYEKELWFLRAHLDRWDRGSARRGEGRKRSSRRARSWIEEQAEELRSRRLTRAADGPLPVRFVPTDDDDRVVKGRVFEDDLVGWLRHFDARADLDGPRAAFVSRTVDGGVRIDVRFADGSRIAASDRRGRGRDRRGPALEILEVYPLEPTCAAGESFYAVVEFVVEGPADGETASLAMQWDVHTGTPSRALVGAALAREAGEHEVLFEAACPRRGSTGQIDVSLVWEAESITRRSTGEVDAR